MGDILKAVQQADAQRRRPDIPVGAQPSAYEVWDREPQTGEAYLLGRITRETGQYGTPEVWRLHLLPDVKYRPDFLMQSDGRLATNAKTSAEAHRVLEQACEALRRWIAENARLKDSCWENLGRATQVSRDEPLPLDGL